ncbi:uncharacterized protein LJ206_017673, partial [Theristicus caerulescens]
NLEFIKGLKVQRQCRRRKATVRQSAYTCERKKETHHQPCKKGLYCIVCGAEILPKAEGEFSEDLTGPRFYKSEGILRKACYSNIELKIIWKLFRNTNIRSKESLNNCMCELDAISEDDNMMLVISDAASLSHLKETLKVYQMPVKSEVCDYISYKDYIPTTPILEHLLKAC